MIAVILTVFAALFTTPLHAHEIRPSIAELAFPSHNAVDLRIATNLEALVSEIGAGHEDTDDSPQSTAYNALRQTSPDALTAAFTDFTERFLEGVTLTVDDAPITLAVRQVDVSAVGDVELPRTSVITLTGTLPSDADAVTYQWSAEFGASVLRISDHTGNVIATQFLRDGAPSEPIDVRQPLAQSLAEQFVHFVGVGFTHIIPKGLDHILFVVGLFLLSMRLGTLLWQITLFTLAHSITLALAMLKVVTLPASLVEPAIAASIVYVCVENLRTDRLSRWRLLVVFLFGLLHGLGFASVLSDVGLQSTQFVVGLIAFNVGVEVGQLAVIAVCFAIFGFFRGRSWYRSAITVPGSAIVGLIGLWWFVERVFLTQT